MLIRGGRVIDPSQEIDARLDVLLADGASPRSASGSTRRRDAEVDDAPGWSSARG
jgi:predicted amidohydrolase